MKLSDFDFDLPEALIATRPAVPRSSARLLVAQGGAISDHHVTDLPGWLRPGDRLVLNDTKVIPARLTGLRHRDSAQGTTQARIDVTLLEPRSDGTWVALIKPLKKLKIGETVVFSDRFSAVLKNVADGQGQLRFDLSGDDFDAELDRSGAMPLPPYIAAKRPADGRDMNDYQTVFARNKGAVAAPTASLHFDQAMLDTLMSKGVDISYVT
ncbi:MAG: S-adenosylmethionine:tRNA ribosyltransferase-isomerase, partial [Sulfitobacter sp.]